MTDAALQYLTHADDLSDTSFDGFFEGWPNPPSARQLAEILRTSYRVVVAVDDNRAVGFVYAISDGELFAFIPMLEVLPDYRHNRIGTELVRRLLHALDGIYAIDLSFDDDLEPFYKALGFSSSGRSMIIRNYEAQSGLSRKR